MGFGVLRALIRPISRTLAARSSTSYTTPFSASSPLQKPELRSLFGASLHLRSPWAPTSSLFHSLTDTRLPKRRPSDKHRRKRAAYKPSGPIVWIKSVPGGEPIRNQPNQGSVKRRNEKKRMQQRREFMLSEKKKRKAELQEANRKKMVKRVERKMAIVARERAWAERLAEMQRLEEEYKKTGTVVDRRTLLESTLHLASS